MPPKLTIPSRPASVPVLEDEAMMRLPQCVRVFIDQIHMSQAYKAIFCEKYNRDENFDDGPDDLTSVFLQTFSDRADSCTSAFREQLTIAIQQFILDPDPYAESTGGLGVILENLHLHAILHFFDALLNPKQPKKLTDANIINIVPESALRIISARVALHAEARRGQRIDVDIRALYNYAHNRAQLTRIFYGQFSNNTDCALELRGCQVLLAVDALAFIAILVLLLHYHVAYTGPSLRDYLVRAVGDVVQAEALAAVCKTFWAKQGGTFILRPDVEPCGLKANKTFTNTLQSLYKKCGFADSLKLSEGALDRFFPFIQRALVFALAVDRTPVSEDELTPEMRKSDAIQGHYPLFRIEELMRYR